MLFWRELKKTVFSISYVLFVIIAVFALHSQDALDFSGDRVSEPVAGGNYGTRNKEIPEIIMPAAVQSLYAEFLENNYKTYPIGFIKNVKLGERERMRVAEILAVITGTDADEIYRAQGTSYGYGDDVAFEIFGDGSLSSDGNGGFMITMDGNESGGGDRGGNGGNVQEKSAGEESAREESAREESINLAVREDMPYTEFKDLMREVDDILGGGSEYAPEALIGFGAVPVTYEEAVAAYELVKSRDKMTGGYARLFSDYAAAMVCSVFPVFLAVLMGMRDKHAKMTELLYTRRISGMKIIFVRFFAILTAVMLPVVILSYLSNATVWGMYEGMELDYLAPLKYDLGWIMPSAMIAIAVGMCLTELTGTPIAVAVQGLWWFADMNMGIRSVSASYSLLRLAPRHNAGENSYFRTQDLADNFSHLLANRLLFAGLSLLLVIVTVVVFEAKRKGKLNGNDKVKRAFANLRNRGN